jgi:hypothetical protein
MESLSFLSRDREGVGHKKGTFHPDNRLPYGRGSVTFFFEESGL